MCTRNITQMSCGHVFQSPLQPCRKNTPSTAPEKTSPNPAEAPSSKYCQNAVWHRQFIADTCVQCDPPRLRAQNRAEYEARHAELVRQLILASDNPTEAAALRKRIEENGDQLRRKNFETMLTRRGLDVEWVPSALNTKGPRGEFMPGGR